jgi:hypothetical protein
MKLKIDYIIKVYINRLIPLSNFTSRKWKASW